MRAPDLESVPAPSTKERPIDSPVEEGRAVLRAMLERYENDLRASPDPWTARYLAEISSSLGRMLTPRGYCAWGHLRESPNRGRRNRCRACQSAQDSLRKYAKDPLRKSEHEDFGSLATDVYARLIYQDTINRFKETTMSYDISLFLPNPGREEVEVYSINYTSNMSQAWRTAGIDFHDFHGKEAQEMAPVLAQAIARMEADFDGYADRFDSPNGWGSMKTLLPVLHRLLDEGLNAYPTAAIVVSA